MTESDLPPTNQNDIAVVGMAAHLPGARNIREFWLNVRDGVESIRPLTEEQLLRAGVSRAQLRDPAYVKAAAVLPDMRRTPQRAHRRA